MRFYLLLFVLFLCSCASVKNYHPSLKSEKENIKKVCVVSTIKVYQITAGNVREYREDYTKQAEKNIKLAIREEFRNKFGGEVIYLSDIKNVDEDIKDKIEEVGILYSYIKSGIYFQSMVKKDNVQKVFSYFNYPNLSEFNNISKRVDTNYFLFFWGVDNVSTAGRVTLEILKMLVGSAVGISISPQWGISIIDMSLVDIDSGRLLWNTSIFKKGTCNFRQYDSIKYTIHHLFSEVPD